VKRLAVIAAGLGAALWFGVAPAGAWSLREGDDDAVSAAAKKKKHEHKDGGTREDEEKEEDVRLLRR